jgi:5-methyltetrahydropteroyltriglutamate--homocysteine methyltransferase
MTAPRQTSQVSAVHYGRSISSREDIHGGRAMKTSGERILTTQVGSIPRPESIRALLRARLGGQRVEESELAARVREAVAETVRRQAEVGLDVVSDGEMSKTSFLAYTDDRLTGFVTTTTPADPSAAQTSAGGPWARRVDSRREWRAFREYYTEYLPREMPLASAPTVCEGPIAYKGQALLDRDLATLKTALGGVSVAEAFVPAIAPAMVGRGQNRYYPSEEAYVFAIAEALRTEYRAIVDAGFILQIDDPGLGETWDMLIPAPPLAEYKTLQARNIDALNHALSGIPEDRVRYHLCWGSWQGPHCSDLGLSDVVDLVLRVKAQAYSIEAATPRHSYEWRVWEHVKLPAGKVLIPGVIAHTTAVVEHPETVAERITTYARLVGRERVMAGADCGFAQGALFQRQHPSVMWAKFEALVEGARLASQRLWR